MKQERAEYLVRNTNEWTGPTLEKMMTAEERKEVLDFWEKMPGSTCFHDAVVRIAKGIPADHRYSRQGTNEPCRCEMCQPSRPCNPQDLTWGGLGGICMNCGATAENTFSVKHRTK